MGSLVATCWLTFSIVQGYGWTNSTSKLVHHMAYFCLLEEIKKSKNRME